MRRPLRSCPDWTHREPDLPCPFCTPLYDTETVTDIIDTARRHSTRTAAEDLDQTDESGWPE
jgi:hypothetical protein